MADVNRGNRPLSPHLSIYRPQLTSMTSILTRITGNAMLLRTAHCLVVLGRRHIGELFRGRRMGS